MIVLVIGGARSGKSAVAESIADELGGPITYLATVTDDGSDPDLSARVREHRARRPESWTTAQAEPDLAAQVDRLTGTLLLDSLGPWVALNRPDVGPLDALAGALSARAGDTVVVSDEVGMSVHPSSSLGREFRDELGRANAAVAAVADEVLLVVAGRVLRTERLDVAEVLGRRR